MHVFSQLEIGLGGVVLQSIQDAAVQIIESNSH